MIRFGLTNAYYAKQNEEGFGTPVHMPGAVSLSLPPKAHEINSNPLSGISKPVIYRSYGSDGKLEVMSLPSSFLADILGYTFNADGSYTENLLEDYNTFALLFETDGMPKMRHIYYNCCCLPPAFEAATIADKLTEKTETLELVIRPYKNQIKRSAGESSSTYNNWFKGVVINDQDN